MDYLHSRFVLIEKENAELKANKNILHSSFYDESYDGDDSDSRRFYENKICALEKKNENLLLVLREREMQLERTSSDKKDRFEVNQLKARVRELQAMVISNEPSRKIAPESLTQEETSEFLIKTLKRVSKSAEMIRSLSRIQEFRVAIGQLSKNMERIH